LSHQYHHPLLHKCDYTWRRIQIMRLVLSSFLHPPVTLSLFSPYISLNTLFSSTLSPCSSLNVRDQVSHPHRTTGKIIGLYIQIYKVF
jgi:hypothetical protein